jgi:streptomycin 6-kinase
MTTRQRLIARFGPSVEPWLDELPHRLAELAQRWRLELGDPIPRGSMSAVYLCTLADGRRAVLKACPDTARVAFEAAALRDYRSARVPGVLAVDEQLAALLLEAIEPGTPLQDSGDVPSAERIADLMGALHRSAVPRPAYPTLEQRVRYLFDASLVLYDRRPGLEEVVPPNQYERERVLALRLARDRLPAVLLHGDLTAVNVLDGGPERDLVAIDPAPCVGDAAFDAVDLLFFRAQGAEQIEARARELARASGLDAQRLLDWCTAFAGMVALEHAARQM